MLVVYKLGALWAKIRQSLQNHESELFSQKKHVLKHLGCTVCRHCWFDYVCIDLLEDEERFKLGVLMVKKMVTYLTYKAARNYILTANLEHL